MSNHDELMSNFFAQPDALAYGKVVYCTFFIFNIVMNEVIRMEKQNSCSRPQHSWDKALMMMTTTAVLNEVFRLI